jgi:hypothetical protein
MKEEGRLPPGQALTLKWPVLHEGEVPAFDPATWDFRVGGLVEAPLELGYEAFMALPRTEARSDFHCVTRWSTFDNLWEGVAFREVRLRVRPKPEATHVMVLGHRGESKYGYTTNIPLADLDRPGVLLAQRNRGATWTPSTAGRCAWWCRTSTRGRAASGSAASCSWTGTSRATGRPTATTCVETRSGKSGSPEPHRPGEFALPVLAFRRNQEG